MIGYTCVGTNDLEKAVAFYGELLGLLGAKPFFKNDRGVGWGVSPDKPMFSVMKPFDGQVATIGNGSMVAIAATNEVSQPSPLTQGQTAEVQNAQVNVAEPNKPMFLFQPGVELRQIVDAVNQIGATPS
ncbi:MAG: hypothetical protein EBS16_08565, partial [Betaproteobacteria bacterium]|nr:hypothetical protein [Betaproteobacteria bacterium]